MLDRKTAQRFRFVPLAAAVAGAALVPPIAAFAGPVSSSQFALSQLDFRSQPNSTLGIFTANAGTFGSSGYLNVLDSSGNWLVQNLPTGGGMTDLTTQVDLTSLGATNGTPLSSANLVVDFSPTPLVNTAAVLADYGGGGPAAVALSKYTDGTNFFNPIMAPGLTGLGPAITTPTGAPALGLAAFVLAAPTFGTFQANHPNVQAAFNQCAPAAVANSLTYLKNTRGINVPQANNPGFGNDGTLVGTLDVLTGRPLGTNRSTQDSGGVWPMNGLLQYVANNNLKPIVNVQYKIGQNAGNAGPAMNANATYTFAGVTATGAGANYDNNWIYNKLLNGDAVLGDLNYIANGGRHYVEITGAGAILGQTYIIQESDVWQADQFLGDFFGTRDIFGNPLTYFEFTTAGGLAMNSNANIDQIISIGVNAPEPGSLALAATVALGLTPFGIARRRQRNLNSA